MTTNDTIMGRFLVSRADWMQYKKAVRRVGYRTASEALREKVREVLDKEKMLDVIPDDTK